MEFIKRHTWDMNTAFWIIQHTYKETTANSSPHLLVKRQERSTNLPSYFPEDCIMSFFFICGVVCCGVVISSSASCRNPFLSVLPWGFPQELASKN